LPEIAEGKHGCIFRLIASYPHLPLSRSVHDFARDVQPVSRAAAALTAAMTHRTRLPLGSRTDIVTIVSPGRLAFVSDIFREIDEELRRDNFRKLWSRYGRYVIAAAGSCWSSAGAIVAWREPPALERRAQSTRYASALALAREDKEAAAVKIFGAIAQEGGGYAVLAPFEEARVAGEIGRPQGGDRNL